MVGLSVVIPFYNEEKNIGNVVPIIIAVLESLDEEYELILVNNGSKDSTPEIIDSLKKDNSKIKRVDVDVNQGYGYGVAQGLKEATGSYLGYIDGDGQFDAKDILKVYHRVKDKKEGLAKGSRKSREDGLNRFVASNFFNLFFSTLFFIKVRDVNAKPKIMSRACYNAVEPIVSKDWFIDSEILIKSRKNGYTVYDVPVHFAERKQGSSNVKLNTVWEFVKNMMHWRVRLWKEKK